MIRETLQVVCRVGLQLSQATYHWSRIWRWRLKLWVSNNHWSAATNLISLRLETACVPYTYSMFFWEAGAAVRITKSSTLGARFEWARIESSDAPNVNKNVAMISYKSPLPPPLTVFVIVQCHDLPLPPTWSSSAAQYRNSGSSRRRTIGRMFRVLQPCGGLRWRQINSHAHPNLVAASNKLGGLLCGGRLLRA